MSKYTQRSIVGSLFDRAARGDIRAAHHFLKMTSPRDRDEPRSITYDLVLGMRRPRRGDLITSIGKRGIGTVYHILEAHKVRSKRYRFRWKLQVLPAPELRSYAALKNDGYVQIRGRKSFPLYWNARKRRQLQRAK